MAESQGGRGSDCAPDRLEMRAIAEGWPVTPERREQIVAALCALFDPGQPGGRAAQQRPRYLIQAARVLTAMSALNLTQERFQGQASRTRADTGPDLALEDLTAEAERRARGQVD